MQRRCLSEAKKKYLAKMTEMDPEGKGIRSIKIAKELDVPAYRNIGIARRSKKKASLSVKRCLDYLQYR